MLAPWHECSVMEYGARGDATALLLPWEMILSELQRLEYQVAAHGKGPGLFPTGNQLRNVVQVHQTRIKKTTEMA